MGPRHDDGVDVAAFLQLQEEGVQLVCGGEGGEAEAGLGGVLEVGAGVREEDEGHCFFCGFGCGGELARGPLEVCLGVRRGKGGWMSFRDGWFLERVLDRSQGRDWEDDWGCWSGRDQT